MESASNPKVRASLGRDALLDAAEAVILRESISRLTLDAVAAQAGASKGGLTHHFPSKERLIGAMVERIVSVWRRDVLASVEAEKPGPGRVPSAMLKMAMDTPKDWTHACRRNGVVLVAALVEFPALVQPMRDFHRELSELIARDDLAPGAGEVVYLALDGLWFKWIFGLEEITGARIKALRGVLEGLISCSAAPKAKVRKTPVRGSSKAGGVAEVKRRRAGSSGSGGASKGSRAGTKGKKESLR
ncbi:MAG: TetR/AcrR family transcriptional regulator [Planctomycetota bacterium]|nr:TetR/AcrR family transcriptional regulator [Planctomycetota bacterium]